MVYVEFENEGKLSCCFNCG